MLIQEIIKISRKSLSFLPKQLKPKVIKLMVELSLLSVADFAGLAILLPLLIMLLNTGNAYNYRIEQISEWYQYVFLFAVFVFFLLKALVSFLLQKKQVNLVAKIVCFVSLKNADEFLNLSYEKRMETDSSLFTEKVYFQPLYLGQGVFLPLFTFFQELVVIVCILIGMLTFYPYVSLGLISVFLVSGIITNKWIRKRSINLGEKNIENRKKLFESLNINLSGMLDISQNKTQDKLKEKLSDKVYNLAVGELDTNTLRIIPFRLNELISVIGLIFLILYAKIINPTGDFITMGSIFALALFRSIPAINRIQLNLVQLRLYSKHLANFNNTESSFVDEDLPPFSSSISLKNIGLMYSGSGESLLKDVNLEIPKGSITIFSGVSGSGKSSLLRIISGQMKATQGEILIDGKLLKESNLNSWQSQVALISQKPFVLKEGIVENITFGTNEHVDLKRIKEILTKVGLKEFIEEVENIKVGEEGIRISEGQKQRLMLARAIYKKSNVLLLDEITANLDSQNTQIIIETMKSLRDSGHTIIISSHNQEVINIADLYCEFRDKQIFVNEYSESEN